MTEPPGNATVQQTSPISAIGTVGQQEHPLLFELQGQQ